MNSILMKIYSGKNLFLPAKTIFASPVFTMKKNRFSTIWQKPANPGLSLHYRSIFCVIQILCLLYQDLRGLPDAITCQL